MKAKPKESFCGKLKDGYAYKLVKSNWYPCNLEISIYYITDSNGYKIPFDEEDFKETFKWKD